LVGFLRHFKNFIVVYILVSFTFSAGFMPDVSAWKNGATGGGYGTHDWVAQHALDWLPESEKQFITGNLQVYLYGTEIPDVVIRDTFRHHIYYNSAKNMVDDAAAQRALEEYNNALGYLKSGDFENATKCAGIMSHYIADVAVFGHVMGAYTEWGAEKHHDDYEEYVYKRTSSYNSEFVSYLFFDGKLDTITAYNAAASLAKDTTFDFKGRGLNCTWMDHNYDWSNPTFKDRGGESINLAVNLITDVLHTLYVEAAPVAYSAKVIDVNFPPQANITQTIVVGVTVQYSFSTTTTIRIGIWDYGTQSYVASTEEESSGSSSKSYTLTLNTPSTIGTWKLRAEVAYYKDNSWQHDASGWYKDFSINVVPEFPTLSLPLLMFMASLMALLIIRKYGRPKEIGKGV